MTRNVTTSPSTPTISRIRPIVWMSTPLTCAVTPQRRIAPAAMRNSEVPMPIGCTGGRLPLRVRVHANSEPALVVDGQRAPAGQELQQLAADQLAAPARQHAHVRLGVAAPRRRHDAVQLRAGGEQLV